MLADLNHWRWTNFRPEEFLCTHCGKFGMDERTLDRLQELRRQWGQPLTVNSGYRCKDHPAEADKPRVGAHAHGRAVDLRATKSEQTHLRKLAKKLGFTGFGSAKTYIHMDDIQPEELEHTKIRRPASWTY